MNDTPLKALVVDDSALYRKIVREVLLQIPGIEVIGTAINGRAAMDRIVAEKPDLITLDLEMPELDGLGLLRELSARGLDTKSIMISALTTTGAQATNTALRLGAFDFVLKPSASSPDQNATLLREQLEPKIAACALTRRAKQSSPRPAPVVPAAAAQKEFATPEIFGIGVSTGGPVALTRILPKLPGDFPCPIVVVQHMPPMFTKSLADDLNRVCQLEVLEAYDGCPVDRGKILIAPGGKQMRLVMVKGSPVVQITDDAPERNCKPAVDYLFRSIAQHFGPKAAGVILTGMGDDGAIGCELMKQKGARIIAQDQETCVVYGMPKSVADAGLVDHVEPLERIVPRMLACVRYGAGI
ncbi:MAG: chemotaxis response regulator protein-glutamate methylesterase [Planctomycetaceae bacterium]|nr:chemotaxis response regulator protein-glutamate methylesterase [Planctomycetaceae bacterium]